MNYDFYKIVKNPDELTALLKTRQFREAVNDWVEQKLRPLEHDLTFETLCQPGDKPDFYPTTETFIKMHQLIDLYRGGGAGHEVFGGHSWRDELHALSLMNNIGDKTRFYHKELVAAMIGQITHDISVRVQDRYADQSWTLGHEKISAFILFHLFSGIFPEDILTIGSYGVGNHTHQVAPEVRCQEGVSYMGWLIDKHPEMKADPSLFITGSEIRRPWNDRLFLSNGKIVRISTWLIRFADRLDAQASTLIGRHIAATTEGVLHNRQGQKTVDLSGTTYYEMDEAFLKIVLKPSLGTNDKKQPSTLQHVLNFANSATKFGVYSQHDHLIPGMRLIIKKASDTHKIIQKLEELQDTVIVTNDFDTNEAFNNLWQFLELISASPILQPIKPIIRESWDALTAKEQAIWQQLTPFIEQPYIEWMEMLFRSIEGSTDPLVVAYLPLVPQLKKNLGF